MTQYSTALPEKPVGSAGAGTGMSARQNILPQHSQRKCACSAWLALAGVVLLLATTPPGKTAETLPILGLAALHCLLGVAAFLYGWPGATMAGLAVIVLICIEVSNRIGIAVLAVARERMSAMRSNSAMAPSRASPDPRPPTTPRPPGRWCRC